MFIRHIFLILILALPLSALSQEIYLNTAGLTFDQSELESLIEKSSWQWNERGGFSSAYLGTTAAQHYVPNAILIRVATVDEWLGAGKQISEDGGYTIRYAYSDGSDCCFEVVLSPSVVSVSTITHELGHAFGYWGHSTNPHDVMASLTDRETLSTADVVRAISGTRWPASTPDLCYVELAADNDLYIPSIGGEQAYLDYIGNFEWELRDSSTNSLLTDCTVSTIVGETGFVTLTDVRSYEVEYNLVQLQYLGDYKWQLYYAE